jgi:hypothetical protein
MGAIDWPGKGHSIGIRVERPLESSISAHGRGQLGQRANKRVCEARVIRSKK